MRPARHPLSRPGARRDYRNADTIEVDHPQLAQLLWERIQPHVDNVLTLTPDGSVKYTSIFHFLRSCYPIPPGQPRTNLVLPTSWRSNRVIAHSIRPCVVSCLPGLIRRCGSETQRGDGRRSAQIASCSSEGRPCGRGFVAGTLRDPQTHPEPIRPPCHFIPVLMDGMSENAALQACVVA